MHDLSRCNMDMVNMDLAPNTMKNTYGPRVDPSKDKRFLERTSIPNERQACDSPSDAACWEDKFSQSPGVGIVDRAKGGPDRRDQGIPTCLGGLTEYDLTNLNAVLSHEISQNTLATYGFQWRNFLLWALGRGVSALPAAPEQVAAYLAERLEKHGHKPATLRMAASAIAFVHKVAGIDDPCASREVKRILKGANRKLGRSQKQAEALTCEALEAIRMTAHIPRRGRGGRWERPEIAKNRGDLDIALISLMRDAMLRVSEAAALTWRDLKVETDGTGRLLIRRSKTDVEGKGVVLFVSTTTMADLRTIRQDKSDSERVFCLRPNQIAKRIKTAAQSAGLGEGFSGHSPRVGMARDLARAGVELPSLMTAGRWRTPVMPAHYVRNETASKGAVAQFHGHYRRVT